MKKKLVFILLGIIICFVTFSQSNPDWLKKAVVYQIYPSSYQDNDGDGFGDIKGIQSRLDYIKSLGVNTLWINPIFKTGFTDGGYDVIDFYKVDPRFGTNSDLVNFIKKAHASGIHVMLDLVPGHSSDQSEWFIQSQAADTNLEHSNYYIWAPGKPADLTKAEETKWVEANKPRGKYYIKNYYDSQPALNYGYENPNPGHPWEQPVTAPGPRAVLQELKDIIAFWMDKGVDGFRVDMASSLVKSDPDKVGTMRLWNNITGWFGKKYPEGALLSQWSNPKQSIIGGGFNIDFFRAGSLLSSRGTEAKPTYFNTAGEGSIEEWYKALKEQYDISKGKGYLLFMTGTHGGQRMASGNLADNIEQLKVAMTFYLMAPSMPSIYYGDEIGMKLLEKSPEIDGSRNRSSSRTPMQWNNGVNAGFSSAPEGKIYLPVDSDPKRPTVESEEKDPNSLLNYVRSLLALRASSEALGNNSNWKLESEVNKPYPVVLLRWINNEKYIITINPSGRKVETTIPSEGATRAVFILGNTSKSSYKISNKGTVTVQLPAISAAVYKLE
jgi:maltose alpha-D-glucosyltransferase / alpha-amylase